MQEVDKIGVVGIILYGLISTYCFVPIVQYTKHFERENANKILTRNKLIFHILVLMSSLLELLYYINIYLNDAFAKWGYACHITGVFISLLYSVMVRLPVVTALYLSPCIVKY
jgi:hypothetical protein